MCTYLNSKKVHCIDLKVSEISFLFKALVLLLLIYWLCWISTEIEKKSLLPIELGHGYSLGNENRNLILFIFELLFILKKSKKEIVICEIKQIQNSDSCKKYSLRVLVRGFLQDVKRLETYVFYLNICRRGFFLKSSRCFFHGKKIHYLFLPFSPFSNVSFSTLLLLLPLLLSSHN